MSTHILMYFFMISRTKYMKNVLVGSHAVLVRDEIHCNKYPGTRRAISNGYPGSKISTRFNPTKCHPNPTIDSKVTGQKQFWKQCWLWPWHLTQITCVHCFYKWCTVLRWKTTKFITAKLWVRSNLKKTVCMYHTILIWGTTIPGFTASRSLAANLWRKWNMEIIGCIRAILLCLFLWHKKTRFIYFTHSFHGYEWSTWVSVVNEFVFCQNLKKSPSNLILHEFTMK